MARKTPTDGWPSGDIEQVLRQIADALPRCGAGALVSVGIDPGISGALGVLLLDVGRDATAARGGAVLDLPTAPDPGDRSKDRQKIDAGELYCWLVDLARVADRAGVVLTCERFMPIPSRRGASMHSDNPEQAAKKMQGMEASNTRLAGTCGEIRGAIEAAARAVEARARIRVTQSPQPQTWRKELRLLASLDKDHARRVASTMYPALAHRLSAKAHHNRAEALLIATYAPRVPA